MSALEKIRNWLMTYPQIHKVKHINVDYYFTGEPDEMPKKSSLSPSGLQEISRREDILGNMVVENQYNFVLEFVMEKALGDDEGATGNADWLLHFQNWVQMQSMLHQLPSFGDDPGSETAQAQNGSNEYADISGNGIYTVQLSINFKKIHEVI